MEIEKLDYYLPAELIAQKPLPNRDSSRLLVLNRADGSIIDDTFGNICGYLHKGDCLVLNDTKVIPARFFAQKTTGAKIEGLFLALQDNKWKVMLKNSARIKQGNILYLLDKDKKQFCSAVADTKLPDGQWLLIVQRSRDSNGAGLILTFEMILDKIGFPPLPPYIKRPQPHRFASSPLRIEVSLASRRSRGPLAESRSPLGEAEGLWRKTEYKADSQRYQTVYASAAGAIAAPTAGLHWTQKLLEQISAKGISIAKITLHVGQGTFLPVKAKNLEEHKIHSEQFSIDSKNAEIINKTIQAGGKIIAVGTTTVRTLETARLALRAKRAAIGRSIKPASGETNLFITPGFEFKITDCLITNFHLPKSTLLALVSAFAGLDKILAAYKHAIDRKYRFFSYGDCMLIL